MNILQADEIIKANPPTIGALRELISAKADSNEIGDVNPFEPLSTVAAIYLSKLEGRDNDEVITLTSEYIGGKGTITSNSPDYKLAICIFRDFC